MGCLGWGKLDWDAWGGRLGMGQSRCGMLGVVQTLVGCLGWEGWGGRLVEGLNSKVSAVGAPVSNTQCLA
jgi:hypothetical protein